MPIGAAIGGAGILSAGAGVASSLIGSNEQANAQKNALAQQQSMFGVAEGALNPFITAGQGATSTLSGLTNPGTATQVLQTLPGFQFQSQYGTMATQNALAAQGLGGSTGPLSQAISQYNQGLAGTYYNNSVNALQGQVNSGVQAGGALAGGAIQSGANQAGNIAGEGNALASGALGAGNAVGGLSGISNSLLLSKLLNGGGGLNSLPNTLSTFPTNFSSF